MNKEQKFAAPYCVGCKKQLILVWKCPECGTECKVGDCGIMTAEGENTSSES